MKNQLCNLKHQIKPCIKFPQSRFSTSVSMCNMWKRVCSYWNLEKHLENQHEARNSNLYQCETCRKKFTAFRKLKEHFGEEHEANGYLRDDLSILFRNKFEGSNFSIHPHFTKWMISSVHGLPSNDLHPLERYIAHYVTYKDYAPLGWVVGGPELPRYASV